MKKENPHEKYAGLYVLTILETLISVKYVDLDLMEIIIRASFLIGLALLVEYRQTNLSKWVSVGIFIMCCSSVLGLYNKVLKEEIELKKTDIVSSKESKPKLDLSTCKATENPHLCHKTIKEAYFKELEFAVNTNKTKDEKIQTLEVQVPFSKLVNVFLYALLAGVFSFAGVYAANVQSHPRRQENDNEQVKKIEPKKLTIEQVQNILAQKKDKVSDEKLATLYGYQSRETFARNYKRLAQEYNLGDQKNDQRKLTVLKGKSA